MMGKIFGKSIFCHLCKWEAIPMIILLHRAPLNAPVASTLGVNQGGVASGFVFRKYLKDLDDYLKKDARVCIDETILAHLLWADDLKLFFDTEKGDPETTGRSKNFCHNNIMIVNDTKPKVMACGKTNTCNVYLNDKQIKQVTEYKYLGNIVRSVQTDKQDIFSLNYSYLRDRVNRAIFLISNITKVEKYGTSSSKTNVWYFRYSNHAYFGIW